jgi:thymidine phosphorylase
VVVMGGGRTKVDDEVDHAVGFVITVKPGDRVERGRPLATVYGRDAAGAATGREALAAAIRIGGDGPNPLPLVSHRVTEKGVESLGRD